MCGARKSLVRCSPRFRYLPPTVYSQGQGRGRAGAGQGQGRGSMLRMHASLPNETSKGLPPVLKIGGTKHVAVQGVVAFYFFFSILVGRASLCLAALRGAMSSERSPLPSDTPAMKTPVSSRDGNAREFRTGAAATSSPDAFCPPGRCLFAVCIPPKNSERDAPEDQRYARCERNLCPGVSFSCSHTHCATPASSKQPCFSSRAPHTP